MVFNRVLARTLPRLNCAKESAASVDVCFKGAWERGVREWRVRGFVAREAIFFSFLVLPRKNPFHEDFVTSKIGFNLNGVSKSTELLLPAAGRERKRMAGFSGYQRRDLEGFKGWPIMVGSFPGRGGKGTPYNGLYGEAPPERGTFFRLQVYKRVGISQVEVYKRVERSVI